MGNKYASFIKNLRISKGLSQSLVAEKLGLASRQSYIAIESGKRELSVKEAETLCALYGISMNEFLSLGMPDYAKYKQMILQFLRLGKDIKKTKLAKLLYLSDFAWYYDHLKSMSGMQYRKIQYGPVPDAYFRALDELESEGKILIDHKNSDGKDMQIISESESNKGQNLDALAEEETNLMSSIYEKWKDKRTAEIVNFTHNQLPYLLANDEEMVSYAAITQEDPGEVY
jgi:transcriptional regulator with XRE-family HTH domain